MVSVAVATLAVVEGGILEPTTMPLVDFPLRTTEEWGEGKGEGVPISRANPMEGAPLPSPLPTRASQGEGAEGFDDGGGVQMRPIVMPR